MLDVVHLVAKLLYLFAQAGDLLGDGLDVVSMAVKRVRISSNVACIFSIVPNKISVCAEGFVILDGAVAALLNQIQPR